MIDSEELQPTGPVLTPLDIARIEALEIGESMNSESGTFSVIRYRRDYTVLVGTAFKEFDNFYQAIAYLQELKPSD